MNNIDLPSSEKTAEAVKQVGRRVIAIKADVAEPDKMIKAGIISLTVSTG